MTAFRRSLEGVYFRYRPKLLLRPFPELPERTIKQLIQGRCDRIGFVGERSDTPAQAFVGDRHNL